MELNMLFVSVDTLLSRRDHFQRFLSSSSDDSFIYGKSLCNLSEWSVYKENYKWYNYFKYSKLTEAEWRSRGFSRGFIPIDLRYYKGRGLYVNNRWMGFLSEYLANPKEIEENERDVGLFDRAIHLMDLNSLRGYKQGLLGMKWYFALRFLKSLVRFKEKDREIIVFLLKSKKVCASDIYHIKIDSLKGVVMADLIKIFKHDSISKQITGEIIKSHLGRYLELFKKLNNKQIGFVETRISEVFQDDKWEKNLQNVLLDYNSNHNKYFTSQEEFLKNKIKIPKYFDRYVKELLDMSDLRAEGNKMKHCVGGYYKKVFKGQCKIFHLSFKGERATLEVVKSNDKLGFKVKQLKGVGNIKVSKSMEILSRRVLFYCQGRVLFDEEVHVPRFFMVQYIVGMSYATLDTSLDDFFGDYNQEVSNLIN